MMIEIYITPTGDSAEAEDPESAKVAARTLMRDATDHGCSRPTASFVVDGQLVRSDVSRTELEGS